MRALEVAQTTIELAVKLGGFAGIPVASVTVFTRLFEIIGRVPQLVHILAPYDVEGFETDISQRLDSRVPFHRIGFELRRDLIRRQLHRGRADAVVQISRRGERPWHLE